MTEEQPYVLVPEGKAETNSSLDFTGRAKATYPNGDSYDGLFLKGVRDGKGVYTWAAVGENPPDVYDGEFQNNLRHGIGKLTYAAKNQSYYGEWQNGQKHGDGLYTYANQDVYSGQWASGQKHGQGSYVFFVTQIRQKGIWHENKLTKGEWIFPNGLKYTGAFEHNQPNGQGVFTFGNGNVVEGAYSQTIIPNEVPNDKSINIQLDWTSNNKK